MARPMKEEKKAVMEKENSNNSTLQDNDPALDSKGLGDLYRHVTKLIE